MIVKIGDNVVDSKDQPVMVILSDEDKRNIANMDPGANKYISYPDDLDPDEVQKWIEEV